MADEKNIYKDRIVSTIKVSKEIYEFSKKVNRNISHYKNLLLENGLKPGQVDVYINYYSLVENYCDLQTLSQELLSQNTKNEKNINNLENELKKLNATLLEQEENLARVIRGFDELSAPEIYERKERKTELENSLRNENNTKHNELKLYEALKKLESAKVKIQELQKENYYLKEEINSYASVLGNLRGFSKASKESPDVIAPLFKALGDEKPVFRTQVASALGNLGEKLNQKIDNSFELFKESEKIVLFSLKNENNWGRLGNKEISWNMFRFFDNKTLQKAGCVSKSYYNLRYQIEEQEEQEKAAQTKSFGL